MTIRNKLVELKLAEWSRTVGMAMIERRATVKELIEAAVDFVSDNLMRIAVAYAEQKTGLTFGSNKRDGDDREHMEWHAKCGCAYHPEPFPHVHPCSESHKRPDLHAALRASQPAQPADEDVEGALRELERLCEANDDYCSDGPKVIRAELARLREYEKAVHIANALQAETDRLTARGWRPIESAPRDGTEVLVCRGLGRSICRWSAHGRSYNGVFAWRDQDDGIVVAPTYWQPLPEPPAAEPTGRES